jgi:ribosomal protein S18 acetylase RimI-like enzyme
VEAFLRKEENFCVDACSKFLKRPSGQDRIWTLRDSEGVLSALLLYYGYSLFPVFGERRDIPLPPLGKRFPGKIPVHAIQGLRRDAEALEAALLVLGYGVVERRDYDLLALDRAPEPDSLRAGPSGLILRMPEYADMDGLFILEEAYQREEVLAQGADFNPLYCSLSLKSMLAREQILAAELGGRLVGKININALSFSRYQVGGVYVLPEYRGRGIARRMTAAFTGTLLSRGMGVNLFVKKQNSAAQAVYRRVGFRWREDYRICYY